MHLYTNYVIRESQAKTSVHPIKKGRAKRGKAALESWGQAKDMWNNVYEVTIVVSTATSASYGLVTWGVTPGRLDLGNYRLRLRVRRRHRLDLWDPRLRAGSRTDSGTDSAKKYTSSLIVETSCHSSIGSSSPAVVWRGLCVRAGMRLRAQIKIKYPAQCPQT